MITRSVLDTRDLRVRTDATLKGQPYDPSGDTVQLAFMPAGQQPASGDWHPATWETLPGPQYNALCLVGPANGGVSLPVGVYQVWIKVTDSPEVPVEAVAWLKIE